MKVGLATATTLDNNYTINDTTVTVASTSGWPTDTGITFAIDVVDSQGVQVPGTYNEFVGTVASATSISAVDWADGSGDRNYSAGATTRVYMPVAKTRENRIVEWGLAEHNQDGTHGDITADSITSTGAISGTTGTFSGNMSITGTNQDEGTNLKTIRSETMFDHVASGCVWSGDAYSSTRAASMTAGVVYIGGKRVVVSSVSARLFTASKDTYIDVDNTGALTYTEVSNNAASPALAANSIRLGIIVTGGSNIADAGSVNQGQENKVLPIASSIAYTTTDSLGNLICPRDPQRKVLGYRQIVSNITSSSSSEFALTGLSVPVIVPAGRKIRVTTSIYGVQVSGGSPHVGYIRVTDGTIGSGPVLDTKTVYVDINSNDMPITPVGAVTSPSAGLHTYNLSMGLGSTNQKTISASGNGPAYIMVELV